MPATNLPLRRALSRGLRALIMTEGVPAINAFLEAKTIAVNPATVLQFSDSKVVIGSIGAIEETTLEIDQSNEDHYLLGTGVFLGIFTSQLTLKIPSVADNSAEDYSLAGNTVIDNLRDVFNSPSNLAITPLEDDGSLVLPAGCYFQDCRFTKAVKSDQNKKDAEGVTEYHAWRLFHHAEITYYLNRPDSLGG